MSSYISYRLLFYSDLCLNIILRGPPHLLVHSFLFIKCAGYMGSRCFNHYAHECNHCSVCNEDCVPVLNTAELSLICYSCPPWETTTNRKVVLRLRVRAEDDLYVLVKRMQSFRLTFLQCIE